MQMNRIGRQTLVFRNRPVLVGAFSTAGPKEGEGPLKDRFDVVLEDDMLGQESFELAESKMLEDTIRGALAAAGIDGRRRPETLTIAEFARLADAYRAAGS